MITTLAALRIRQLEEAIVIEELSHREDLFKMKGLNQRIAALEAERDRLGTALDIAIKALEPNAIPLTWLQKWGESLDSRRRRAAFNEIQAALAREVKP